MPTFRRDLKSIVPYDPGKPIDEVARELGLSEIAKLASNESPVPPFAEVQAAVSGHLTESNRYPDNSAYYLRDALAERLGIPFDHIWVGAGVTELLHCIAQAAGGPGTSAVYADPSFLMYPITTQLAGAERIAVPLTPDHRHDLEAMVSAIRDDTTVVYVCNPNNPTGTYMSGDEIAEFMARVPDRVLIVVDEAYFEYVVAEDYRTCLPFAQDSPNVLVARSFSKIYGLAGLRVGYAVTRPENVAELRRAQLPFSVNALAQVAAVEALRHQDQVERRAKENAGAIRFFFEELGRRDVSFVESQTNFVLIDLGDDPAAQSERLLGHGVIVRPMGRWVRVTVGTEDENQKFFTALDTVARGG